MLVNEEMLTNEMHAASTETVPMRCREKVRPAVTDKLTSVRRCVTNEHCQPADHTTFATNKNTAANSLASELYCYWKPEAPCVG